MMNAAKHEVRKEYPQITHRHGNRIKLCQLAQNRIRIRNQNLSQNDGTGQDDYHPDTIDVSAKFVFL